MNPAFTPAAADEFALLFFVAALFAYGVGKILPPPPLKRWENVLRWTFIVGFTFVSLYLWMRYGSGRPVITT